jgi:hypothetical protein
MRVFVLAGRLALGFLALTVLPATPAFAQVDIVGEWAERLHEDQPTRLPGAMLGDYTGVPLNAAARFNAETWDSSLLSLKEHQQHQYSSVLAFYAPFGKRISKVIDERTERVTAYRIDFETKLATRTIWMDGRPHPPEYAAHTWAGFSTGRWDGRLLTVTTTHLKAGYMTRQGVRQSDRATMTEHFARHGNYLTVVQIVDDPVYLDEPFVQTWSLVLNPDQRFNPTGDLSVFEEVGGQPKGYVPHYLPGRNPYIREFADLSGLPFEATQGGRETMYPEYARKMGHVKTKALPKDPVAGATVISSSPAAGAAPGSASSSRQSPPR